MVTCVKMDENGAAGEEVQMDQIMMDDRVAAMMQLQQIQQKQEQMALLESHPVSNADAEFRRGLEELVQDHLNTCMALASCSSSHEISRADNGSSSFTSLPGDSSQHSGCESDDEERIDDVVDGSGGSAYAATSFQSLTAEQLQEGLEAEDESERDSSAHSQEHILDQENVHNPASADSPGRRQSRILQIWDTRAEEEMITTLERQAREAELLALAGQHTVSMLDASFLQESPTLRPESTLERGHRRASSLVQMWRGIEGERSVTRDRAPAEGTTESEVSTGTQTDFSGRDAGTSVEEASPSLERSSFGNSAIQTNELTDTGVESRSVYEQQQSENGTTTSSQATEIGEMDRERVREIVQHWARQNVVNGIEAGVRGSQDGLNPWLGQNERERVRHLVRAWVETSSQGVQRPDVGREAGGPVAERSEAREIGDVEFGRHEEEASEMVLEVLMRIDRERQRELERLTELRTVSDFSQRNRLQVYGLQKITTSSLLCILVKTV